MSKMSLSVVMGMIDKISEPMKKITGESNRYTEQIKKIQKAQADDSAALALIASYKRTEKQLGQNSLEMNAAKEKLDQLKQKMKEAKQPSAQLEAQLAKQKDKVDDLKAKHSAYQDELKDTANQMKKAGVNTKKLDTEFDRLTASQKTHAKELAKVETRYDKVKRSMSAVNKVAGKFRLPKIGGAAMGKATAFLGGLSIAGFAQQLNSTASEMDTLAKQSKNLNLPIEELQALESQAEYSGMSSEKLNKSLATFNKNFGEYQSTGKGMLASYLKNADNPLAEELKTAKDTKEAYGMVLEAFSKLKSEQEQAAFANKMFGGASKEQLIMLREGTEGLLKARQNLADVGGGVSLEDAEKAEAYNDSMQKLGEIWRSIKSASLAPIMEKLTKTFTVFANQFKDPVFRQNVFEKISKTLGGLFNGFKLLTKGFIWASQHFTEIIAVLALFKIAIIAINAAMYANPIVLIIAGIAAAIVVIGYLINKFVGFDKVMEIVKIGFGYLKQAWDVFYKLALKSIDWIKAKLVEFDGVVQFIKKAFFLYIDAWKLFYSTAWNIIVWLAGKAMWFIELWANGWKAIFTMVSAGFTWLSNAFGTVSDWLQEKGQIFIDAYINAWSAIFGAISAGFEWLTGIFGSVMDWLEEKGLMFTSAFTNAWDNMFSFATKGFDWVKKKIFSLIDAIPDFLIPDEWKESIKAITQETEKLNQTLDNAQAKSGTFDVSQNQNQTMTTEHKFKPYSPIMTTQVQSKSEVALTIKSDKPVQVDKAQSDKNTDVQLNTGGMNLAY